MLQWCFNYWLGWVSEQLAFNKQSIIFASSSVNLLLEVQVQTKYNFKELLIWFWIQQWWSFQVLFYLAPFHHLVVGMPQLFFPDKGYSFMVVMMVNRSSQTHLYLSYVSSIFFFVLVYLSTTHKCHRLHILVYCVWPSLSSKVCYVP